MRDLISSGPAARGAVQRQAVEPTPGKQTLVEASGHGGGGGDDIGSGGLWELADDAELATRGATAGAASAGLGGVASASSAGTAGGGTGKQVQLMPAATVVTSVARRTIVWLASKGARVSAHIAKRHIAKRLGKSTFASGGRLVKDWLTRTISNPDNVVDQGRRMIFEKAFGRVVGRSGERIIRVVVDKATGKVITAFPTHAFKAAMVAAVTTAAATAAGDADAAILERRAVIAEALEPGWLEWIADLLIAPSVTARDEDEMVEAQIVEAKIDEAIATAEAGLQRSLEQDERDAIREQVWTELEHLPGTGEIE
jgi:hypothetical protein